MANSQSSERPDLQDLVAYMQGRGSEDMRAQVLQRLDEDEEYLELMMDLVPMLREAGELADPDSPSVPATATPAPPAMTPQRLVDAELPAVAAAPRLAEEALPAMPGKVVALPRPASRPYGVFAALAAMIPIAVAVWMTTRPHLLRTGPLAAEVRLDDIALLEDDPWRDATRGQSDPACNSDDSACFEAGGQMLDLHLALGKKSDKLVRDLLRKLSISLGSDFPRYFPSLVGLPKEGPLDLDFVKEQVESGDRKLSRDQDRMIGFEEGACLRAAILAAKSKNPQFFSDRQARRDCLEVVGEENWKPEPDALEELFIKLKRGDLDLP